MNMLTSEDNANKKKHAIKCNVDCEELCSSTPILVYADYSTPFNLHTDACNLPLGAVLYQTCEDGLDKGNIIC